MEVRSIKAGTLTISEVISKDMIIKNTQDVLDILGNVDSEYIVLHTYNFEEDFFDLSTRKLGEALQKFSNYHIKLAIVGNFENYKSSTLKNFIYESNKQGDYLFLPSIEEVIEKWNR